MALADQRREYQAGTLDRSGMAADPVTQFQRWFAEASATKGGRLRRFAIGLYKAAQQLLGNIAVEPNAMVLATVDAGGRPSARTVLLKGVGPEGFTFFTNYESRKGQELANNPQAALVFYWSQSERQVCVSGTVTKLTEQESAAYFHSRPRGSQIGAWASQQSRPLADRKELQESVLRIEARFKGREIPLPPFWGGYVLAPERMEFWQGRVSRLHDRFEFTRRADGSWALRRLNP
jgi:pyridoxamine 5'-phosphate oxidase